MPTLVQVPCLFHSLKFFHMDMFTDSPLGLISSENDRCLKTRNGTDLLGGLVFDLCLKRLVSCVYIMMHLAFYLARLCVGTRL